MMTSSRSTAAAVAESSVEQRTLRLSLLETQRQSKRQRVQTLFDQIATLRKEMSETNTELVKLDEEIEELEAELERDVSNIAFAAKVKAETSAVSVQKQHLETTTTTTQFTYTQTQANELLTDPGFTMTMDDEMHENELLTEPSSPLYNRRRHRVEHEQADEDEQDDDLTMDLTQARDHPLMRPTNAAATTTAAAAATSSNRAIGQLQIVSLSNRTSAATITTASNSATTRLKDPPLAAAAANQENQLPPLRSAKPAAKLPKNNATLDYLLVQNHNNTNHNQVVATAPPTDSRRLQPSQQQQQQPPQQRQQQQQNYSADARFQGDNFPWSQSIVELLRNTFAIQNFREHQKEIINATLSREDVFVIMRTGGGKSLTYQLPALLEGRGPQRKVTFVVSPLLSLITDQEEQMNEFAQGSAVSFTSNVTGGNAEHTRRWNLVRDPNAGVCLVFITPEKVSKSNRLQNEMQKLFDANRLGRVVIDEAHCASQWGHDFRPDYAQLGMLKSHFPSIPIIAVTATASDKVREDVCRILRIGTNYRFFRSTAHRPNLHYSIRPKSTTSGADNLVTDMAAFIKEKHARHAGIVYTFSKKDADTVAKALCEFGVTARSYHSDVTPKNKELIHRSWMKNQTQVVVATIAFGLYV